MVRPYTLQISLRETIHPRHESLTVRYPTPLPLWVSSLGQQFVHPRGHLQHALVRTWYDSPTYTPCASQSRSFVDQQRPTWPLFRTGERCGHIHSHTPVDAAISISYLESMPETTPKSRLPWNMDFEEAPWACNISAVSPFPTVLPMWVSRTFKESFFI